jgi:microsomal dipeptidase-like Zn-dependent dipeptidase
MGKDDLGRAPGRCGGALRAALLAALSSAVGLALVPAAASAQASNPDPSASDRYDLAGGCFALRSEQTGQFVRETGVPLPVNPGYSADAASAGAGEPFRMQATDLGRYLLYGADRDFLGHTALNVVAPAANPSDNTDWTVSEDGGAFRIANGFTGRELAVNGAGELVTVAEGAAGAAGLFGFAERGGCAVYPEIDLGVSGSLPTSRPAGAKVSGFVETHMHQMAFEFLGTKAHCGRPWHRFGAPYALVDCPDHEPNGCGAVLETALSGTTCHDTGGWPTFAGWPAHHQLTHEQSYHRWLERSWRGGLRVFVNLLVENRVLCQIYPLTPVGHSCDEMDSVRRQAQRMHELERYIDAQSGGPGRGWYRIVTDPVEARRVINQGKLAVVMGMEVSEPFGCRLMQPGNVPTCTEQQVKDGLDELHDLGVRQLELVNKFDNGISGVAGDSGTTGTITNTGNVLSAGRFWDLGPCEDAVNHDHSPTAIPHNDDDLVANVLKLLPGGTLPAYGPPPHCNEMGLTAVGEVAIKGIMDRGMIFDPDHMSVVARNRALDLVVARKYGGVTSSHSWSTDNALPRISALGGLIGPMAGTSQGFVDQWNHIRNHGYDDANPYGFALGKGADMNGFASQGGPRTPSPGKPGVSYPFESFDGSATIHRQVSGERTFDLNTDGVAHYGLYPDWVEDVRILGGPEIVEDLAQGAEAYLQMWERAAGVGPVKPGPPRDGSKGNGAKGKKHKKKCRALRAKMKRAKSRKAKRKLKRKLRKRC